MTDLGITRSGPGRSRGWPARRSAVSLLAVVLAVLLATAAIFTGWYRVRFRAWPWPSSLPDHVSYCDRHYTGPGPPLTLAKAEEADGTPIRRIGRHGFGGLGQPVYANPRPEQARTGGSPLPCAMVIYLRNAEGRYVPYVLSGGP
ncbi:hypothetical protein [Frankia sp. R82]|uniref:hypothetical protein n=1 Tax=Frankia sp. R82 TaxID=2950553 RepID=UPI0020434FD3|nr:hypothetical protein [Frankia sp. R82]MCM3886748.1 hypothetical protein [Frankia sp. R82]